MTDDELIEAMARAIFLEDQHSEWAGIYGDLARAALDVAKREIIERCAQKAERSWIGDIDRFAAGIRSLADD